jgi:metal-responsive CopG/Arc/MetJ family transcriptional regulator
MSATKTKRISLTINANLWDQFTSLAQQTGQSQRSALEQALLHYLQDVAPAQHLIRPRVMEAFEQSVSRNRDLLQPLAK